MGSSANNMTKATAIIGVTCFLVLSATVYVALSDKDHSTTDIGSPSATTDLHVEVKDAEADGLHVGDSFFKHTAGSGQCDKPQLDKIDRSIKAAAPKIQYAIDNKNDALWTKWFGQPTSENPDDKVVDRMKDGLKRMDDRDWQPLCCPVSGGDEHCKSCTKTGSRIMAFVNSYRDVYNNDPTKYQWNRITLCADTFSETDMTFGFTLFHEAVHMISNAGDGNGDYSKENLVSLALNKPDVARLTSNSYMLYTMQNSLSDADYEKTSDGWGNSLTSLACTNKWSNCHDLGNDQNSCASGTLTNGQAIGVDCCEACSQFDLSTTQSTSNPGNNQNGACADEKVFGGEAWTDSAGDSCADYKKNSWCILGTDYKNAGLVANQACCTCGGGSK